MRTRNIDIMPAGMVNTYFQLASQIKCMNTRITSIALTQETPIMKIHVGAFAKGHQGCTVKNEQVVSAQSARKTNRYLPSPP